MKKILLSICFLAGSMSLMATNDTIKLELPEYDIDYAQANYYESGGKAYYKFIIGNEVEDTPELRLETQTDSKTHIQGSHDIIIDANISRLTLLVESVETEFPLTKASLWLKYIEDNIDGDPVYDILSVVTASDGKIYKYKGRLPIYAYDEDDSMSFIALEDTVDDSVVDPETSGGSATAVENTSASTSAQKLLRDNQILIEKNGKVFNALGVEVR